MKTIICLSVLGLILLYAGFFKNKKILIPISITGLVVALGISLSDWNHPTRFFHDMMFVDNYSIAFTASLIVITILIFLFANDYYRGVDKNIAEIHSMTIFSLTGAVIITSFSNVAMLFIGVEIMSIPLYILAGGKKFSIRSNEASFKYFILGSFATALFLLGITLIYGASATFSTQGIADYISSHNGNIPGIFYTGLLFVIISFAFKVGAVPFHFWVPDVYEGSPTHTTLFMATVVKSASIAAFYKFFSTSFAGIAGFWQTTISVILILTLIIGNFGAIRQEGIKRMLAYSGIAHTGFMLLAILAINSFSASSVFFYTIAYSIATILAFGVLMLVKNSLHGNGNIEAFNGIGKTNPFLAFAMLIAMLSLAGIPVTAGFFAKYYIFLTAVKSGFLWVVIIAILLALVAVYYYFRIIIAMYFRNGITGTIITDYSYKTALVLGIIITLALGIVPFLIIDLF